MKLFLMISSLLLTYIGYGQGELQRAKDKLSSPPMSTSSGSEELHTYSTYEDSPQNNSSWDDISFWPAFLDLTLVLGYNIMVESSYEKSGRMRHAELSPYPYYKDKGDYTYDKHSIEDFSLFRTVLSNELFVSEHLFQNHLEAKIRFASRFGVKLSYRHFWEKWRGYPTEHLDALSLTAQYYRIRTEHVSLAWGVGASYLGNQVRQWGFALTSDGEVFIRKPFSLAYALQFTTFDYSDMFSVSVGGNYYYKNYYMGAKYQYHNIASAKFSGMLLSVGMSF